MTIHEAQRKYRISASTSPEWLETGWRTVLTFGDKVLLAGYCYNGEDHPSYFGAVYEFLTDDHSCEGEIVLKAASNLELFDNGHAIQWAIQEASK